MKSEVRGPGRWAPNIGERLIGQQPTRLHHTPSSAMKGDLPICLSNKCTMRAARCCSLSIPGLLSAHLSVSLALEAASPPEPMRLSDFLRPDFVISHLEARDVDGIVREVSARADSAGIAPQEVVAQKLLEREKLHPTVMGSGLAIPHATVPGLREPVIGLPWPVSRSPSVRGARTLSGSSSCCCHPPATSESM